MKPVYQTKLKPPDGNCFNACVASILEISLDYLPDLCDIESQGKNWLIGLNEFLRPMGYGVSNIPTCEEKPVEIYLPEYCYFIASGDGLGGVQHSVVMQQKGYNNIEFIHDPIGPKYRGLKKVTSIQVIVKI